jgi:hypothetical protein
MKLMILNGATQTRVQVIPPSNFSIIYLENYMQKNTKITDHCEFFFQTPNCTQPIARCSRKLRGTSVGRHSKE